MLQVPLVDAPVTALQYSGLRSEDVQGSFHDNLYKCIDVVLRCNHEATAMAIRASAIASVVSRASIVWLCKLSPLIPEGARGRQQSADGSLLHCGCQPGCPHLLFKSYVLSCRGQERHL